MKAEGESQLIEQARRGEIEAFMELVKKYEHRIFQLTYRLSGNREDAADLAQETFLQAFRAIKDFRGNSSFHTWLHRIAVNRSLNFLKRHNREKSYRDEAGQIDENSGRGRQKAELKVASPEDSSLSEEFRAGLKKAIEELPPAFRATFSLVVGQEMSHKEAAEVLGCSEGTVSWRMHEARKMLKKKLQPFLT
ncbi:MAG TPA: sigma-70 family RNA polymerase sigma factor [Candidatus Saccharicenans sp.]|jgi:RNA polymerase sigma-70 factor (ECF subfamily)|nr:sigma-70 family RNA polymerase sigma factor [Candidatus Saccharicenans sp.]HRD02267.1 sigma-70 family RNA polymerase sigma factor [Candidatus Saccharicenans sp.]